MTAGDPLPPEWAIVDSGEPPPPDGCVGWGIENGLHQRFDASTGEDACRVRTKNAGWVLGMFRRLAVSLFIELALTRQNKKMACDV